MKLINNLPQKLNVQTQLDLLASEISQLQADLALIKEQLTMDSQESPDNERRTS
ncbi:MAG: hypothetical protein HFH41_00440 [Lachnospiraceae bacterium]|nr:hypothetical protein [Lachnospiraceae bacterium]